MSNNRIVIDCRAHILGRLASVVAKHLLNGGNVTLLRCEKVNLAGNFRSNKGNYLKAFAKRTNYNHLRGPFHQRSPAYIMRHTIRGMVPHKTARGKDAMSRLHVYDGCPPKFAATKKLVVPEALTVLRLKSCRDRCELGRISSELGWHHAEDVAVHEAKRIEASAKWYEERMPVIEKAREMAAKDPEFKKISAELQKFGY